MQLYAITDRSILMLGFSLETAIGSHVQQWAADGVDWVQLREKSLPQSRLCELLPTLARLLRGSRTRLVVNGLPPRLALKNGAHGVHLPGGATVESVRAARAEGALVTVSCHTEAEVRMARDGGASALLWAPVFEKRVAGGQVVAGTGLDALALACRVAAPTPVFALGGITLDNAEACLKAGAAGIAGIRIFHKKWPPSET